MPPRTMGSVGWCVVVVTMVAASVGAAPPLDAREGAQPSRTTRNAYLEAVRLHWQKDYVAAASRLEDVVEQFARQCGSQSAHVARALLSLGWSRFHMGDIAAAEQAFGRSLAIEEARHGPAHGACVGVLRALGMLHEAGQNWERAAEAYERCVACLYEGDAHSLPTLAEVLERYAAVLRKLPVPSSWFGVRGGTARPTADQLAARARAIRARVARQSVGG